MFCVKGLSTTCTDFVTYRAEEQMFVEILGTRQKLSLRDPAFRMEFFYETESGEQVYPVAQQLHEMG